MGELVGKTSPQQKLEAEIGDILALTSKGKETWQERYNRNAQLREKLCRASNSAIAYASVNLVGRGGLVERELLSRLKNGEKMPLEPIFEIVNEGGSGPGRTVNDTTLNLFFATLGRSAPFASQDEMVRLCSRFLGKKRMDGETSFLPEVLSWREDADAIAQRVATERPREAGVMENLKRSADLLRAGRNQKANQ